MDVDRCEKWAGLQILCSHMAVGEAGWVPASFVSPFSMLHYYLACSQACHRYRYHLPKTDMTTDRCVGAMDGCRNRSVWV